MDSSARMQHSDTGEITVEHSSPVNATEGANSNHELQYKILIKNKTLNSCQETEQSLEKDRSRAEIDEGEERLTKDETEESEAAVEDGEEEGEEDSEEEDYSEDDEDEEQLEESIASTSKGSKKKKKKVKVAVELSNLVIYTKSVKFVSFSHSRESQRFYENTSLGEKKARKLAMKSGPEFILHNTRFLSRIYPAGSRTLSSNYNPQEFWNMGSQLVALNFQSRGLPMDLNNGRFRDNGGCGYVLKPHFLRCHEAIFDPSSLPPIMKPVQVLMKVISGSNLPISKAGKPTDPYVRVEINGVPSDCRRIQCEPVKHNSLNPKWDASMNFVISVPELALVRFTIRDYGLRPANDFMGQYTLPFTTMKRGYRWVPLVSREGRDLDPASLFIFVWHS